MSEVQSGLATLGVDGWIVNEAFTADQDGSQIIAQTGVQVPHTGDTTKTLLYTVDIPAGMVGPGSSLEVRPYWSFTNSVNNKIVSVDVGPDAGSVDTVWTRTRTTSEGEGPHILLFNRGEDVSQIMVHASTGDAGTAFGAAYATYAIDFSVDNKIFIYGQLASAGEEVALEALRVVLHGPKRQ